MKASELRVGDRLWVYGRIATIEQIAAIKKGRLRIYHSRGQFDCNPDDMVSVYK